jgi:hypothetical protein
MIHGIIYLFIRGWEVEELRHNIIISPTPTFYSRKLIDVQGDFYDVLTQADYIMRKPR